MPRQSPARITLAAHWRRIARAAPSASRRLRRHREATRDGHRGIERGGHSGSGARRRSGIDGLGGGRATPEPAASSGRGGNGKATSRPAKRVTARRRHGAAPAATTFPARRAAAATAEAPAAPESRDAAARPVRPDAAAPRARRDAAARPASRGRGGTTGSAGRGGTTGSAAADGGTTDGGIADGGTARRRGRADVHRFYTNILVIYCAGSSCHNPGTQGGVSFSSQSSAYSAVRGASRPATARARASTTR